MSKNLKISIFLAVIMTSLLSMNVSMAQISQNSVAPLDPWTSTTSPTTAITQRTFGRPIYITGLTFGQNLCLDNNGLVTTTGCSSGGGGGSGGGTMATSSSQTPGINTNHPISNTDILTIGSSATSSAKFYIDPNTSFARFLSDLLVTGSTTLQNFTFKNATGTQATTTNLFSTNGTFTNLFGTGISGFGLTSCTGTSALTFTGTGFTCTAQQQGTITALTGDVTASGSGSVAATLATVASAGTTGSSTAIPVITINAKGLTTGITTAAVIAPAGTLTGATLAANVLSSSLTSVGTLSAGAVPASLVTSGAFGSGNYTFPGTLGVTSGLTTLSNLLVNGSSTLQNFTALNSTTTNATTTSTVATTICFTGDTCRTTWPSGNVSSVTANDTTLTISPTTGAVLAGLNLSNNNIWTSASTTFVGGLTTLTSTTTSATTTNANITNLVVTNCTGCGSGGGGSPGGTGSELQFRGGASTFSAVSNSAVTSGGAFVGIGTTTPESLLELSSSTAPQLTLTDGLNTPSWSFREAGGNLYLASTSPKTFATSTLSALSIVTGGNFGFVGIGTTTPGSPLQIATSSNNANLAYPIGLLVGNSTIQSPNANGTIMAITYPSLTFTGDVLRIQSNFPGADPAFNIDSSGNVTMGGITRIQGVTATINASGYQIFGQGSTITLGNNSSASGVANAILSAGTGSSQNITGSNAQVTVGAITRQIWGGDGFSGIGTSTPKWALDIATSTRPQLALSDGIPGDNHWTFRNAGGNLYLATSSPSTFATSTTGFYGLEIDSAGHLSTNTGQPTLSSCGGSPSVTGDDNSGTITVGTTATGCTASWATTHVAAPHCVVSNQSMSVTNAMTYTESITNLVITQAVGLSGDLIDYQCTGH